MESSTPPPDPPGQPDSDTATIEVGLSDAVGRMLGVPVRRIVEARTEPLAYDAFLAHRTVGRVRGIAQTRSGGVGWSLIQKVTEGPGLASAYLYDNGLREFRAYESGLIDDLAPHVRAA